MCCWADMPDALERLTVECRAHLDPGIRRMVEVLSDHGVHTFESCQGRSGGGVHAYPEPTVAFHGGEGAGWQALAIALDHGLPMVHLRRRWDILDGTVTGPYWEMTFREAQEATHAD